MMFSKLFQFYEAKMLVVDAMMWSLMMGMIHKEQVLIYAPQLNKLTQNVQLG